MKGFFAFLSIMMVSLLPVSAALAQEIEMADQMRADGKIYVVVATIGLILAGILLFLIWMDRRISRLEKENSKP